MMIMASQMRKTKKRDDGGKRTHKARWLIGSALLAALILLFDSCSSDSESGNDIGDTGNSGPSQNEVDYYNDLVGPPPVSAPELKPTELIKNGKTIDPNAEAEVSRPESTQWSTVPPEMLNVEPQIREFPESEPEPFEIAMPEFPTPSDVTSALDLDQIAEDLERTTTDFIVDKLPGPSWMWKTGIKGVEIGNQISKPSPFITFDEEGPVRHGSSVA